ncbi:AfsR/SARP family transcriptional regulator [Streptomonospora arabica]|uniref:AfsR/SARP family transcriptional regulator n=1 Tax=Streptomonospora arabica TaxID=412417 RepID=UPI0031D4F1B7
MRFGILGRLEVVNGDLEYTPGSPKLRQLLALLLCSPNKALSTDAIIDELWCDAPPRSVTTTLQTYVYQLRKAMSQHFPGHFSGESLVTCSPGYVLRVPEDRIDSISFERYNQEGREHFYAGHPVEARAKLNAALALWRGDAMADVQRGHRLQAHAVGLEEQRIECLQLRIAAEMRLGRQHECISELRSIVATYPLNEWFYAQLMCALTLVGRRGEALEAYQDLRRVLTEELGLDPSPELQRFQMEILNADAQTLIDRVPDSPGSLTMSEIVR